ncbi:shikimate kinase [Dermacoccaceae bacterium W4C1]
MVSRPRLVLIGPPGAGKTTVGQLLARRWQVPFADTDALIEAESGRSVQQIFAEDGEGAFRELEAAVVARALGHQADADGIAGVVALGGGAPMTPRVQQALAGLPVVFLDVSAEQAGERVGDAHDRPLLAGDPSHRWRALMDQRRSTYSRLATAHLDTAPLTAEQVAAALLDDIRLHSGMTP